MARTQQDRLIDALKLRGWEIDINHRTNRYIALKSTPASKFANKCVQLINGTDKIIDYTQARWFVGKSGALRWSPNGNITSSIPRPRMKEKLLGMVP